MGRKSKAKFKMKGHTLPGINQRSETANNKEGRSPSSAFQMAEPGDSPNKFLGLAAMGAGAALGRTKWGKSAIGKIGGTLKNIGGKFGGVGSKLFGGGDNDDAAAGKELLKAEAKAEMEEDTAMTMKLKTGKKKQ
tara:strand:+ start:148 stop:552 length:405 start_codon:yes stop_codon:yes gene_type:complete